MFPNESNSQLMQPGSDRADESVPRVNQKLDVTLIDAFRIRDLNLLIFSYILRQTHNTFIKQNELYVGGAFPDVDFAIGAIVGIILTGILADLVLQNKRFLSIFLLNVVLFFWDIYLFCKKDVSGLPSGSDDAGGAYKIFVFLLGAVLASNDLIYLVLIPMLIAKNHSERMTQHSQF